MRPARLCFSVTSGISRQNIRLFYRIQQQLNGENSDRFFGQESNQSYNDQILKEYTSDAVVIDERGALQW